MGGDSSPGTTYYGSPVTLATAFISSTQLTGSVPGSLLIGNSSQCGGAIFVGSSPPSTGGAGFFVQFVLPAVSSVAPTPIYAGTNTPITVNGSAFVPGTKIFVSWQSTSESNQTPLTTTYVNASQVTAVYPSTFLPGSGGTYSIIVANCTDTPTPGLVFPECYGSQSTMGVAVVPVPTVSVSGTTPTAGLPNYAQWLPDARRAVPYSFTFSGSNGKPPYAWSTPTPQSLPPGLSLSSAGVLSGTPLIERTELVQVNLTDANGITVLAGFLLAVGPVHVNFSTVSSGQVGTPIGSGGILLNSYGGHFPLTWTVVNGPLPPGLTLTAPWGTAFFGYQAAVLAGTPTAAGVYPVTFRVSDSSGTSSTGTMTITITGSVAITTTSLPSGAVGEPYSATVTAQQGTPPYAWSVSGGALPSDLTLNPATGTITGTPTAVGTSNFTVRVTDSGSPQQATTQAFSITIGTAAPTISSATPSSFGGGNQSVGGFINGANFVAGSIVRWNGSPLSNQTVTVPNLIQFTVPPSLRSQPGSASLTVVNPDGSVSSGFTVSITNFTLGLPTPVPTALVGVPYSVQIAFSGGVQPYSITSHTSSNGLTTSSGGLLSGTPLSAAPSGFRLDECGRDGNGSVACSTLIIPIVQPLSIASTSLSNGTVGVAYSASVTAQQGTPPYVWSVSGGALPAGLLLNAGTGAISGMPTGTGTSSFTVRVTDSGSPQQSAAQAFTVTIDSGLTITTSSLPSGTVGVPYFATVSTQQGKLPYAWALSIGALPAGLNLDLTSGAITGTPTVDGTASFTLKVTDSSSPPQATAQALTITVAQGLTITTTSLANGTVGVPYNVALSAQQGTPPYTWSLSSGALPAGLILSSYGLISGTPSSTGTLTFTVQVTDNTAASTTQVLTLAIDPALSISLLTPSTITAGGAGFTLTVNGGGFGTGAVVQWNGSPLQTTFVNSEQLMAQVPATYVLTPGSVAITILMPDQSVQGSATFEITRMVLPDVSMTGLEPTAIPTQPISVGLALSGPAPEDLNGTLTLSFRPNAAALPEQYRDPATLFATGGSTLNFTVAKGSAVAELPSKGAIQQGTVAGDITVTLTRLMFGTQDVSPSSAPSRSVTVPRLAPVITPGSVKLVNFSDSGFEVELIAYSTPRDITTGSFTFSVASNAVISGSATLTVDLSSTVANWYSSAAGLANGSAFKLRVPFTVTGDTSLLQSVSVMLTNSIGRSEAVNGGR